MRNAYIALTQQYRQTADDRNWSEWNGGNICQCTWDIHNNKLQTRKKYDNYLLLFRRSEYAAAAAERKWFVRMHRLCAIMEMNFACTRCKAYNIHFHSSCAFSDYAAAADAAANMLDVRKWGAKFRKLLPINSNLLCAHLLSSHRITAATVWIPYVCVVCCGHIRGIHALH